MNVEKRKKVERAQRDLDERAWEKIRPLTDELVEHYHQLGVHLDQQGHIRMSSFRRCRPSEEIRRHQQYVRDREQEIRERSLEAETESELFEYLVPIMFTKLVGDKAIVVRTAKYDDMKNGIDTVIINRETGDIACSVDEVVSSAERRLHKKERRVLSINSERAHLDYSYMKKEDGSFQPSPYSGDFPLCSLSVPKGAVYKIINQTGNLTEVTEFEKKVFNYFINNMCASLIRIYLEEKQTKRHDHAGELAAKTDEQFMKKVRETIEFLKSLRINNEQHE